MKYYLSIFILSISLFFSCSQNNNCDIIAGNSIRLNVDSMQAQDFSFYDLFEEVECINLDSSNKECILSTDYIMKLSDSLFFFLDYKQTGNVFIYNSQGKWIKRLDKIGRGHGEYLMASDIFVNENDSTLDVLDPTGHIFQYDLCEFRFKNKFSIPDEITAPQAFCYNNGRYILYTPYDDSSSISMVSISDNGFFRIGKSLERFRTELTIGNFNLFSYKDTIRFFDSFDGTIYTIDCENNLSNRMISWDFGKKSPNNFDIKNEETSMYYINWVKKNQNDCVVPFTKVCESESFILLSFGYRGHMNILKYDKITEHCSSFYRTCEGVRIPVGIIRKGYMYSIVRPELLSTYVNDKIQHRNCSKGCTNNYIVLKYKLNE